MNETRETYGTYETYRIWAPDDALWTQWAKPVLFAQPTMAWQLPFSIPDAAWAPYPDGGTALILDLPGEQGVLEGLALARMGYRPVPLYNGVGGSSKSAMAVDVTPIVDALFHGAQELAALSLRSDLPPVFLLDSNRMHGVARSPGKYDNRWCVFPQDMPSADFLLANGIRRVCVRSSLVQNDLTHILRRYQEKGIGICFMDGEGRSKELTVVRPSRFRSLQYRFLTMLGFSRNAAGGFGGFVPEATQASGVHYHGIG